MTTISMQDMQVDIESFVAAWRTIAPRLTDEQRQLWTTRLPTELIEAMCQNGMTRDEALAFVALYGDQACDLINQTATQPAARRGWWPWRRGR